MNGNSLDLAGTFSRFWSALGLSGAPAFVLAAIGMLIIVFSLIGLLWNKRRGGGGNTNGFVWAIIAGGVIAAPGLFLPLLLKFIDLVVNAVVRVATGGAGL